MSNYIRLYRHVVTLDGIHAATLAIISGNPHDPKTRDKLFGSINLTYLHKKETDQGFSQSCLEFDSKEDAEKAFDKIAEALGGK